MVAAKQALKNSNRETKNQAQWIVEYYNKQESIKIISRINVGTSVGE